MYLMSSNISKTNEIYGKPFDKYILNEHHESTKLHIKTNFEIENGI